MPVTDYDRRPAVIKFMARLKPFFTKSRMKPAVAEGCE